MPPANVSLYGSILNSDGSLHQEIRHMLEPHGDRKLAGDQMSLADHELLPDLVPFSGQGTQKADGRVEKTEIVRLAYQFLLGREPENEDVLVKLSDFTDVYDLRNRFMLGEERKTHERFFRLAELTYVDEAAVRADTDKFNAFMSAEPELERRIREIIDNDTGHVEYTRFHTRRFFDQIRAAVAVRTKLLGAVERVRLLEVGTSPVSRMYAQVMSDVDIYTANLPAGGPPEDIAQRFGSKEHYYIDLDTEDLSERHPVLVENPFHIVLFCEVIEHIRASPEELFSDLLRIVAPGGVLIVSTPNAMSALRLFQYTIGRKPDSVYRKTERFRHEQHHLHVREYTLNEIRSALVSCGAKILMHAAKDYYSDSRRNLVATKYISAGEVQIALATK